MLFFKMHISPAGIILNRRNQGVKRNNTITRTVLAILLEGKQKVENLLVHPTRMHSEGWLFLDKPLSAREQKKNEKVTSKPKPAGSAKLQRARNGTLDRTGPKLNKDTKTKTKPPHFYGNNVRLCRLSELRFVSNLLLL